MIWKVEFDLECPDEVSVREAQVTVNDALQAMAEQEGDGWAVRKVEVE